MAVLVRVVQAHGLAGVELDPPRTLHLQKKCFDRIVHIDQLAAGDRRLAAVYRSAVVVRHHPIAIEPAAQPLALEVRTDIAQVDGQQIRRRGVKRCEVGRFAGAAASEQGFVITGDQRAGGAAHAPRRQVAFEKYACFKHRRGVRFSADAGPARLAFERAATGEKRAPCLLRLVLVPAGQLAPLGARPRWFGRCIRLVAGLRARLIARAWHAGLGWRRTGWRRRCNTGSKDCRRPLWRCTGSQPERDS